MKERLAVCLLEDISTTLTSDVYALTGSIKVWDFGSGQEIKLKPGKGAPDEDLSVVSLQYITHGGERCLVAVGWYNTIRMLVVRLDLISSPSYLFFSYCCPFKYSADSLEHYIFVFVLHVDRDVIRQLVVFLVFKRLTKTPPSAQSVPDS